MNGSAHVTFDPDDREFVYAVVRRIVSPDDAEDVTQEALLLAYRYRDSFRGDSRYHTWLYRIAATAALGHLRKRKREKPSEVIDEHLPDPAPSSEATVAAAEMRALVHRALGEIAPMYRDVLVARADASEPEVAAKLGISVANVKIRAHRARKALREILDRFDRAA